MSEIKRVWSDKKTTWNDKEQVWLKDGELKKYDGEWKDVEGNIQVYDKSSFETLPGSAELDTYDSNTPEFIGTVEDGIESAYVFKDWDGTVLASGKVKDGETPTAPENPTREGYEFTGWNPTVGPITKSTEYIAQYEQVIVNYTVTIVPNDDTLGTVDVSEVVAPEGTEITSSGNELYIGGTTVTATAEEGCEFVSRTTDQSAFPLAEDCTYTAIFQSIAPLFNNLAKNGYNGERDVLVLFADSESATDRVELYIDSNPDTGDESVVANGYGAYAVSDPSTDLQQSALLNFFTSLNSTDFYTAFLNWATWQSETGTIDSEFIDALKDAWDNYETASYRETATGIVETAAQNDESLITTNRIYAETVGQPDENSVTVEQNGETSVRFNYTPTTVTPIEGLTANLEITLSDDNVAGAEITGISYDGEAILSIYGYEPGTTTLTYGLSGSETTYSIDVTVTAAAE